MTRGQKPSPWSWLPEQAGEIETVGSVVHPHSMGIQDFSVYGTVLDVRSPREHALDHVPGAVQVTPDAGAASLSTGDPEAHGRLPLQVAEPVPSKTYWDVLETVLQRLPQGERVLMYDGRRDLDALPLAARLRERDVAVDILPGGYASYRRWVQGALRLLPRVMEWRVVATSLSCESSAVLRALAHIGHQVLDIGALAGWSSVDLVTGTIARQPSQALFESRLVDAIRSFGRGVRVWVADVPVRMGTVQLPDLMVESIARSPTAVIDVPIGVRVARWTSAEGLDRLSVEERMAAFDVLDPAPASDLRQRFVSLSSDAPAQWTLLLEEHFDMLTRARLADRMGAVNALPRLQSRSLDDTDLEAAARDWLPVFSPFADGH